MKQKTLLALAALALVITGPAFGATTLLNDNFDSYANQAAFQSAWTTPVGSGGTLSTVQAVTAPNSVNFGTVAARNDRTFAETANPAAGNVIAFSFNFYDSNAGASPYRQISSLIDGAGSAAGQLVSLGMNNNQLSTASGGNYYMARILGYTNPTVDPDGGPNEDFTASGIFFKLNDYGVGLRSTGWHTLGVTITDTDFNFFVDGVLAEHVANAFTLRSYDSVRLGSGLSSTTAVYFDDVLVQLNPAPIPEPSTIACFGLGVAALLVMRRRKA